MTFSQKWFYAKLFKSFFQQFLLREKADIVGVFCFSEDSCLVYKDAMFISPHKFMGGVCTPGKNRDFWGPIVLHDNDLVVVDVGYGGYHRLSHSMYSVLFMCMGSLIKKWQQQNNA